MLRTGKRIETKRMWQVVVVRYSGWQWQRERLYSQLFYVCTKKLASDSDARRNRCTAVREKETLNYAPALLINVECENRCKFNEQLQKGEFK